MFVSAVASATELPSRPQLLSILTWVATPRAAPPSATTERALEASATRRAFRKPSPGSAAIHGAALLRTFSTGTGPSPRIQRGESFLATPQTRPELAILGSR